MDKNGYPEEDELETIRKWDLTKKPAADLLEYFESLYNTHYGSFYLGRNELELITGGWSANESLIDALSENWFWTIYWKQSNRGGRYLFNCDSVAEDLKWHKETK